MTVKLIDVASATTLAQILPVLLLSLMVELRRLDLHRRGKNIRTTRVLLGSFFAVFGIIETALVLSTDGHIWPMQWSDLIAGIIIFALLLLLFLFSMMSPARRQKDQE
jgi:hypothetical protein